MKDKVKDIILFIKEFIKNNIKRIALAAAVILLGGALIALSVSMLAGRDDAEETTQAPGTTVAPEVTTEPAPETTVEPEVTTEPAPETTVEPEVTTEPAPETTVEPEVTTEPAPETTVEPEMTTEPEVTTSVPEVSTTPETTAGVEQEGNALEEILKPAQITLLRPVASGILTKTNSTAVIDYSNTKDGYVMVKYTAETDIRLKVQVKGSTTTYTYNLTPLEWTVFPLSDGNGSYQVKVFRNTTGNKYAAVLSETFEVDLDNEFAPFLRPNQYVNYENATATMEKAAMLVAGKSDLLEKVGAVYSFVVNNISYDYEEAATVQSGYLPDLDEVLATKKGICFDYAALMTGMLRSQNIPCKLVVGYAGKSYHAWISVWSPDEGWIDGAIFFNGVEWQIMDPTFVSTGGPTATTGVKYTSKYIY